MKQILGFTLGLICAALFTNHISAAEQKSIEGHWAGNLDANGVKLRIVFHASKKANGTWNGTMDSPDQGARGIPMNVASSTSENVRFDVEQIMGKFSGKMSPDGKKISGHWAQGPVTLPLTLERTTESEAGSQRKANAESVEVNRKTNGKLTGQWKGTLNAGAPLRLLFKIEATKDGALLGSMDSLDQGARNIPATAILPKDAMVQFEFATIGASYEGRLDQDGKALSGTWKQGGAQFPLRLEREPGK